MKKKSCSAEFEKWGFIFILEMKSEYSKLMFETLSSSSWANFIISHRIFLIIWGCNQKIVRIYEQKVLIKWFWIITFHFHFEIEKSFSKSSNQTLSSSLESDFLINKRNCIVDHYIHQKAGHIDDWKISYDVFGSWLLVLILEIKSHFSKQAKRPSAHRHGLIYWYFIVFYWSYDVSII
jgi:hypothetical protein